MEFEDQAYGLHEEFLSSGVMAFEDKNSRVLHEENNP